MEGAPYRCLLAAQAGLVELSLSEPILAEFRRVLTGKFRLASEQVEEALLTVREMATLVKIGGLLRVVADDPEDDKFLETAQVAGAEYLVSGDHHLLKLGSHGSLKVLTARAFLDLLSQPEH